MLMLLVKQAAGWFQRFQGKSGKSSSLPTMLPCLTLTCLSFHNLDFPKNSTTEREPIVDGVVLSIRPAPFTLCSFRAFIFMEEKHKKSQHTVFPWNWWLWGPVSRLSFKTPCYIHLDQWFIVFSCFFPRGNPWNQKPHGFFPFFSHKFSIT